MITLHGEEVKRGERVWDLRKGWGEVSGLDDEPTAYPILVRWEDGEEWYSADGKLYIVDRGPTLFWQPIEIPKKPKPKEKAWQWICRGDVSNSYWITPTHYTEGEEVLEFFPNAEPIEPYLPSEIEREVKE